MQRSISPDERRALRAQAHHLSPVVMIGNDGLTAAVLHEIDVNLRSHGLIKIRAFTDDRDQRARWLDEIANALEAAPVQHIGKLLVVYRPLRDADRPAPAPPDAPAKRRSGGTGRTGRAGKPATARRPGPGLKRKPTAEPASPRGIAGRRRPRS